MELASRRAPARLGPASSTAGRSTPGTYIVQSEVRDTRGQRRHHARRARGRRRHPRPPRPDRARDRGAAAAAARDRRQAGSSSASTPAGASYRWRVRRVGEPAVRKRGEATRLAARVPRPGGRRRARTCSSCAPAAGARPSRSSSRRSERARLLVVVPTMSWLGTDKVDDPPFDGLPNTLADGGTVRWPRVFNGKEGLPAGFADDVAPLLVFLDRRRIRLRPDERSRPRPHPQPARVGP